MSPVFDVPAVIFRCEKSLVASIRSQQVRGGPVTDDPLWVHEDFAPHSRNETLVVTLSPLVMNAVTDLLIVL